MAWHGMHSHPVSERVLHPKLRKDESEKHHHGEGKDIAVWTGLDRVAKILRRDIPGSARSRPHQGSNVCAAECRCYVGTR